MKTNREGKSLWFIAGLGIGAGATWFLATNSGRRTQLKLRRMAEEGCDRVAETSREILDKGKELAGRGKDAAVETRDWVGEKLHIGAR